MDNVNNYDCRRPPPQDISGSGGGGGGALMYNVRRVCAAYKTTVFTPDCRSQDTRFSIICRSVDPRNDATPLKIRSLAYTVSRDVYERHAAAAAL